MSLEKEKIMRLLLAQIEKDGTCILQCLDAKELVKPLIFKDWLGTGGKLGYESLASRYGLSLSQIKTICSKFEKPAKT